jgi:hypothetical protein
MKITLTIFACLIGCATHVPDVCRVAELETLLSPPAAAMPDTTPDIFEDETNAIESEFHVGDYVLYEYIDSSIVCPPCIRWAKTEKHRVACKVKQHDISQRSLDWVRGVPAFRLYWCNTDTKQWDQVRNWGGFTSADSINAEIEKHRQEQEGSTEAVTVGLSGQKLRLTESDLRSWVSQNYTPMTRLRRATVSPRSFVWRHLREDHGFTGSQVNGLPQWQALALHDAVHPRNSPLVTPWVVP